MANEWWLRSADNSLLIIDSRFKFFSGYAPSAFYPGVEKISERECKIFLKFFCKEIFERGSN